MCGFAIFNLPFLTYLGRLTHQPSLWYLNYVQVKPISSKKLPKTIINGVRCFRCYKTSSWKKTLSFVDFALLLLDIKRKAC